MIADGPQSPGGASVSQADASNQQQHLQHQQSQQAQVQQQHLANQQTQTNEQQRQQQGNQGNSGGLQQLVTLQPTALEHSIWSSPDIGSIFGKMFMLINRELTLLCYIVIFFVYTANFWGN